jgi:predicted nucleotidyltransferase
MKVTKKYRKIIQNISQALERNYAPDRIVLFGSYASGKQKADSDIDLLIVKKTSQPFYKRLATVRKIVSPMRAGMPFDPIVVTPQELTARLELGDQFLGGILRSGKTLYAKP